MQSSDRQAIIAHLEQACAAAQAAQDLVEANESPAQAMRSAFRGWQALREAVTLLVGECVCTGELTKAQVSEALRTVQGDDN